MSFPGQVSGELTNQYQIHFSKKLLEHAVQLLVMQQFAEQSELPKNVGSKTIRFFIRDEADTATVVALTEGETPVERRKVNLTPVDIPLVQIGQIAEISDVVGMTALFNMLKLHIEAMGEDCALHADNVVRDSVVPQVTAAGQRRFSGGAADFNALVALSAPNGKFTSADALAAVTQLKVNRAPTIGGHYVAVIPPQVGQDLQQDNRWVEASKYGAVKQLFRGELGMLDGVRYVEHTNPWREHETLNTYAASGGIFSTLVIGRQAFGCPKLAGTQSPHKPSVMIVNQPTKSDPLNQRVTVGWKAYYASKILQQRNVVTIRSKSTFSV